jgi:amidase
MPETPADQPNISRVWMGADDALGDDDAVGVADRISSGEISAAEAVDAAIERAERAEPLIAAFATTDFDRARQRASGQVTGRFAGLPTAMKDQTAVAGLPLGLGSQALDGAGPSVSSSPITKVFESVGTISLGTTTLPEFGLTSSSDFHHGPPTRNPWNRDHIAGGSSSGAAALVAAGVVPMAHGGDGGGSIRIPAAACGLVGLKPSRGRLPHENDVARLPVKISAYGVLSRSVGDQCAFLAAAERYFPQPALPPVGLVDRPLDRPLRIGVLSTSPVNRTPASSVVDAVADTASLLEQLGHHVTVIDEASEATTQAFGDDFVLYWAFLAGALAVGGKKLINPAFDSTKLTSFTRGLANHAPSKCSSHPGSDSAAQGSARALPPAIWGVRRGALANRVRPRTNPGLPRQRSRLPNSHGPPDAMGRLYAAPQRCRSTGHQPPRCARPRPHAASGSPFGRQGRTGTALVGTRSSG